MAHPIRIEFPHAQSKAPPVRRRCLVLWAQEAPVPWTQEPRPYVFRSTLTSTPEAQEGLATVLKMTPAAWPPFVGES